MNRPVVVAMGGLFLLGAACGHTKSTEATSPPEAEQKAKERKPASSQPGPQENGTGGIPVASTPEALLVPGADKQIRDKLVAAGFLREGEGHSMEAALRRFQKAHDLPETGIADHQTVQSLGLDPNHIFKHAEASPSDHQERGH
jgi:hypothetical protein